ncbi:MGMT family protein [Candidatus Amesbacteria bacterium]|nr:MGMT family protein [Candidatus Amesbacteria bacterium]
MTFFEKVWQEVAKIPKRKVATYGQIAQILGTRDARRIGHALHANKDRKIPCHRVVMKDGSMAPGFTFGGSLERCKIQFRDFVFWFYVVTLVLTVVIPTSRVG